mmetsp:Transcript_2784/g.3248  ORF Transcript_2784/g.3248 Transcript_2784/m.3248 type:complete len:150 (+) Transcript_2784:30-479(+)
MMKVGFTFIFLAITFIASYAQDAPPTEGFEHASGEDVLINLQGENNDFWVVSFFQPGDNYVEVRDQIKQAMTDNLPEEEYKYGEVSLSSGYEYQKLLETLDLVGEPKRGHTTPQVLTMKGGEGYIVYGPDFASGVTKRYVQVRDGGVFK